MKDYGQKVGRVVFILAVVVTFAIGALTIRYYNVERLEDYSRLYAQVGGIGSKITKAKSDIESKIKEFEHQVEILEDAMIKNSKHLDELKANVSVLSESLVKLNSSIDLTNRTTIEARANLEKEIGDFDRQRAEVGLNARADVTALRSLARNSKELSGSLTELNKKLEGWPELSRENISSLRNELDKIDGQAKGLKEEVERIKNRELEFKVKLVQ